MAERIPPLTPRQSRAVERHEEIKRLAEMAWKAILSAGYDTETRPSAFAEDAWVFAEFMQIESENRRPVE